MLEAPPHLDDGAWFHGSPRKLDVLATGSTVTRSRPVAEAFAHRPTWVSVEERTITDDEQPEDKGATALTVTHNGKGPGFLHVIDEPVTERDLHPHPESSHPGGGLEWVTDRPLRLRLIAELPEP